MQVVHEKDSLYQKTAEKLGQLLSKFSSEKEKVVLGLPGGRSILPILNYLSKYPLDWKKIYVFIVDERLVPINHPASNFKLIKEGLSGIIPEENLNPFIIEDDEQISLKKYEEKIKQFEGFYDILVVSIGEDGHIGSLYPNHPSISNTSEYYILVEDSPKPPSRRMSMSAGMVLRSKACVVIVSGTQKKDALSKYLDESLNYADCPAKLTLKITELFVFTDINLKSNNI